MTGHARKIYRGPGSVESALALMRAYDEARAKTIRHAEYFAGLHATKDIAKILTARAAQLEQWADEIRLSHAKSGHAP